MTDQPWHVFIDFDGTITREDTIGPLMQFVVKAGGNPNNRELWEHHLRWYLGVTEEYERANKPDLTAEGLEERGLKLGSRALETEIYNYIHGKIENEQLSVIRLNESGIFDNLDPDMLYNAGKSAISGGRVERLYGFANLVYFLKAKNCGVTIVSLNWSNEWIKGCISPYSLEVISNNIHTGRILGPCPDVPDPDDEIMLTGEHKLAAVTYAKKALPGHREGEISVYIGDSTPDLECMMSADKAIVMCGNREHDPNTPNFLIDAIQALSGEEVKNIRLCDKDFKFAWASSFTEILESGNLDPGLPKEAEESWAKTPSPVPSPRVTD